MSERTKEFEAYTSGLLIGLWRGKLGTGVSAERQAIMEQGFLAGKSIRQLVQESADTQGEMLQAVEERVQWREER